MLPLLKVSDHDIQFNFDEIAKRFIDTGGRAVKFRFGSDTVTFTAGRTSATVTVSHGLGSEPVAIFATAHSGSSGAHPAMVVSASDSDSFDIYGRNAADVDVTGTNTFYWLAIG